MDNDFPSYYQQPTQSSAPDYTLPGQEQDWQDYLPPPAPSDGTTQYPMGDPSTTAMQFDPSSEFYAQGSYLSGQQFVDPSGTAGQASMDFTAPILPPQPQPHQGSSSMTASMSMSTNTSTGTEPITAQPNPEPAQTYSSAQTYYNYNNASGSFPFIHQPDQQDQDGSQFVIEAYMLPGNKFVDPADVARPFPGFPPTSQSTLQTASGSTSVDVGMQGGQGVQGMQSGQSGQTFNGMGGMDAMSGLGGMSTMGGMGGMGGLGDAQPGLPTTNQPPNTGMLDNTYLPPQPFYPIPNFTARPTPTLSSLPSLTSIPSSASVSSASAFNPSLPSSSLSGFSPNSMSVSPAGQAQGGYFMPQGAGAFGGVGAGAVSQDVLDMFYPVAGSSSSSNTTQGQVQGYNTDGSDGIAQYTGFQPITPQHAAPNPNPAPIHSTPSSSHSQASHEHMQFSPLGLAPPAAPAHNSHMGHAGQGQAGQAQMPQGYPHPPPHRPTTALAPPAPIPSVPKVPKGAHISYPNAHLPFPPQLPLDIPPMPAGLVMPPERPQQPHQPQPQPHQQPHQQQPQQPHRVAAPAAPASQASGSRGHGGARGKEPVRYSPMGHYPVSGYPSASGSGSAGRMPPPPPMPIPSGQQGGRYQPGQPGQVQGQQQGQQQGRGQQGPGRGRGGRAGGSAPRSARAQQKQPAQPAPQTGYLPRPLPPNAPPLPGSSALRYPSAHITPVHNPPVHNPPVIRPQLQIPPEGIRLRAYPTPDQLHEIMRREKEAVGGGGVEETEGGQAGQVGEGGAGGAAAMALGVGTTLPPQQHSINPVPTLAPLPNLAPNLTPNLAPARSTTVPARPATTQPLPTKRGSTARSTAGGTSHFPPRPSPLRTSSDSLGLEGTAGPSSASSSSSALHSAGMPSASTSGWSAVQLFENDEVVGWDAEFGQGVDVGVSGGGGQFGYQMGGQDGFGILQHQQQQHMNQNQQHQQQETQMPPQGGSVPSSPRRLGVQATGANRFPPQQPIHDHQPYLPRLPLPQLQHQQQHNAQQDFPLANDHSAAALLQPLLPPPPDLLGAVPGSVSARYQNSNRLLSPPDATLQDPQRLMEGAQEGAEQLVLLAPPFLGPAAQAEQADLAEPADPDPAPASLSLSSHLITPGSYLASLLDSIPNEKLRVAVESKAMPLRIRQLVSPSLQHVLLGTVLKSETFAALFSEEGDTDAFLKGMEAGTWEVGERWSEGLHLALLALGSQMMAEKPESEGKNWAAVTDMFLPYAVRTLMESNEPGWDWTKERTFVVLITLFSSHKEFKQLTPVLRAYKDGSVNGTPFKFELPHAIALLFGLVSDSDDSDDESDSSDSSDDEPEPPKRRRGRGKMTLAKTPPPPKKPVGRPSLRKIMPKPPSTPPKDPESFWTASYNKMDEDRAQVEARTGRRMVGASTSARSASGTGGTVTPEVKAQQSSGGDTFAGLFSHPWQVSWNSLVKAEAERRADGQRVSDVGGVLGMELDDILGSGATRPGLVKAVYEGCLVA
ncbi:hypothetical protein IAT38_002695 [Cryptococcus sp. DSM 104549]